MRAKNDYSLDLKLWFVFTQLRDLLIYCSREQTYSSFWHSASHLGVCGLGRRLQWKVCWLSCAVTLHRLQSLPFFLFVALTSSCNHQNVTKLANHPYGKLPDLIRHSRESKNRQSKLYSMWQTNNKSEWRARLDIFQSKAEERIYWKMSCVCLFSPRRRQIFYVSPPSQGELFLK